MEPEKEEGFHLPEAVGPEGLVASCVCREESM